MRSASTVLQVKEREVLSTEEVPGNQPLLPKMHTSPRYPVIELDPLLGETRTWKLGHWRFIKRDDEER
jgi:hypothetical protein